MNDTTVTLEDVADLVRVLALTTQPENPDRPGSNLVEPGLIAQLRSNIVPDGAGVAGTRKQASVRIPVNAAAVDLLQNLGRWIGDMYVSGTDKPAKGSPEEMLVDWYVEIAVAYNAGDIPDALLEQLHARLDGWRTQIMDHFLPPERGDIPKPCPRCDWTWMTFHRPDGDVRQYALVRIARPWRGEAAVRCRKCGAVWTGREDLVELADELGIPAGLLTDDEPAPEPEPPVDDAPLYLCVMTPQQASQYARDHELPADRVAVAASGVGKVRRTHRPIVTVTAPAYQPGPNEQARVDETLRVAALVNTENGHTTPEEVLSA